MNDKPMPFGWHVLLWTSIAGSICWLAVNCLLPNDCPQV